MSDSFMSSTLTSWVAGSHQRCCSAGAVWTAPSREKKENSWAGGSCVVDFCGLKGFVLPRTWTEVVKTDSATTRIPELDFEIPAFSQKGGVFKIRVFVLFMHCS